MSTLMRACSRNRVEIRLSTYGRLEALFDELTEEERVDLLALGWLGRGDSGGEWQPIFRRACATIDMYADDR